MPVTATSLARALSTLASLKRRAPTRRRRTGGASCGGILGVSNLSSVGAGLRRRRAPVRRRTVGSAAVGGVRRRRPGRPRKPGRPRGSAPIGGRRRTTTRRTTRRRLTGSAVLW